MTHLEIKPGTCILKVDPLPQGHCQCRQSLSNFGGNLISGYLIMYFFYVLLNYEQYECWYTFIRSHHRHDFSILFQFIFKGRRDSKCLSSYLLNYLDKLNFYRGQNTRNVLNGFIFPSKCFKRLHHTH